MSSAIKTIGMLGLGEVGVRIVHDLLQGTSADIVIWDKQMSTVESQPWRNGQEFKDHDRVAFAQQPDTAFAGCDLVLSAVTAEQAIAAATLVAPSLSVGAWFVDFNSVAPRTKKKLATLINPLGVGFVEAAIMSPIEPQRLTAPILLAGPHAKGFMVIGKQLGFSRMQNCSSSYGKAAATKICRSVIIKGMEALVSESMLTAKYYGVEQAVLDSLNNLFPRKDWPEHACYLISRTLEHGERRAEEMSEAVITVKEAGIEPLMTEACQVRQQWAPQFNTSLIETELDGLLTSIRQQLPKYTQK
jgi:3-hydroxyisobutyrate dehydrogenase-like beta-hydroxyacid dehydrogenase